MPVSGVVVGRSAAYFPGKTQGVTAIASETTPSYLGAVGMGQRAEIQVEHREHIIYKLL